MLMRHNPESLALDKKCYYKKDTTTRENLNIYMIIDSHTHLNAINGSYDKAFRRLLEDMAENDINKAIVIADNVADSGCADVDTALGYGAENIFVIGSPNILREIEGEYQKLEKLLAEGKIIGLKFFPGHDAYFANDQRCFKYFELALKYNRPVVFHTGINSGDDDCAKYNDPKYIVDIARRYPELKIIISHYFWPRMDYCYEITKGFKNIYFDTSAMADPEVVAKSGGIEKVRSILLNTLYDRPDSVIFGTDYNMCDVGDHKKLIASLEVNDSIKQMVWHKNAESVFKIL